jgi:hypothetical protein
VMKLLTQLLNLSLGLAAIHPSLLSTRVLNHAG